MIEIPSQMRRFVTVIVAAVSTAVFAAPSEISISGEQDGFLETGHYLVTGSITVKRGKTLTFAPGCIVRFKRYAGIVVEGTLKCAGSEGLPILFTSENHRVSGQAAADAPAPFDWNGILVTDSLASVDLEKVHLLYSTFGLDVKSSKSKVHLSSASFDENGQFNVRVNGEQLEAKDNKPFFYDQPSQWEASPEPVAAVKAPEPFVAAPAPAPEPDARVQPAGKPHARGAWRSPVRIGLGALALAGTGAGVFFDSEVFKYQKRYNESRDTALVSTYSEKCDKAATNRNISYLFALIMACGFSITFLF
jgi:hypothetical protein